MYFTDNMIVGLMIAYVIGGIIVYPIAAYVTGRFRIKHAGYTALATVFWPLIPFVIVAVIITKLVEIACTKGFHYLRDLGEKHAN